MTELEKKQKIELLKKEFMEKADELEKNEPKTKINRLDNGRTKYTELFEEYKEKIENIKNIISNSY